MLIYVMYEIAQKQPKTQSSLSQRIKNRAKDAHIKVCFRELQNNIFATHDIQRQERHSTNSYTFLSYSYIVKIAF